MPKHDIACSASDENIRESIRLILLTRKGERLLHPDFGTRLHEYVFENLNRMTENMICAEVISALHKWEERIGNIEVRASGEDNHITIDISYTILDTGIKDTVSVEVK